MELVDSDSILQRFYYRYIHEPFVRVKERWWAYFVGLLVDEEKSPRPQEQLVEVERPKSPVPKNVVEPSPKRENMSRGTFFVAALGTSVGLAHLRLPTVAYRMGGIAFFIIYCALTLLFGYTMSFVEVAAGQYTSKSTLTFFRTVPLMQGVGYSIVTYSVIMGMYLGQVVAMGLYYVGISLSMETPWLKCPDDSGTEIACLTRNNFHKKPCIQELECPSGEITVVIRDLCHDRNELENTRKKCCGSSGSCKEFDEKKLCRTNQIPTLYYWTYHFLKPYPRGTEETFGEVDLTWLLCTFITWLLIYLSIMAGFRLTGIIGLFLFPGITFLHVYYSIILYYNHGHYDDLLIEQYIPTVDQFLDTKIWLAALEQSIYTLALAMGTALTLGSVSRFRNPCHIDLLPIILVVLVVGGISLSTVIFLGNHIRRVPGQGTYSVFRPAGLSLPMVVFTDLFYHIDNPWVPTLFMFFLYSTVGAIALGNVFNCTSTAIADSAKFTRRDRNIIKFLLPFACFFFSIPITMRGGLNIIEVLDGVCSSSLPVLCLLQLITIYMYGLGTLCEDIAFMLGFYPCRFYRYMWMLWPVLIVAAIGYFLWGYTLPKRFDGWTIFGYTVAFIIFAPTVFSFLWNSAIFLCKGKEARRVTPLADSCPAEEDLRMRRKEFHRVRRIF